MRHNKHVTATRPLQRNFAAAFRITPNAGCVPGTGAVRMLSGAGQGAWDGTGSSAKEATKKRREEPREQRRSSRGSRKNNDRNSSGSRTGTMQDQPKQQKEQRQEQRRGKTGTAAEATAGRTEEGKLQRKIRSSTYNPEAAFAKNFNNKAAIKSQPKSKNPVTNKTQNEPPKAGLSATRRRKEKNPADTGCKKVTRREQFDNKFIYL